jgi:hypothetical protein
MHVHVYNARHISHNVRFLFSADDWDVVGAEADGKRIGQISSFKVVPVHFTFR